MNKTYVLQRKDRINGITTIATVESTTLAGATFLFRQIKEAHRTAPYEQWKKIFVKGYEKPEGK